MAISNTTRYLKRSEYLNTAIETAFADLKQALEDGADPERAVFSVLHRHLGDAWDAGAKDDTDCKLELEAAQKIIERQKRIIRDLNKRVNKER